MRGKRRITSDHLNNRMAVHIQSGYRKQRQPTGGRQLKLSFGSKYREIDPRLVLAKDSRFEIVPDIKYSPTFRNRYPDMTISWRYTIGVSSKSPEGEVEVVRDIVEFLDKNPELVLNAGNEIIEMSLQPLVDRAEQKKDKILNNREFVKARETIKSIYLAAADQGSLEAEKKMLMLMWFDNNYDKMNEIQRFIMWKNYIQPLADRTFRSYGPRGDIDHDTGKPRNFDDEVYEQARKLGAATDAQARGAAQLQGTMGEPRPAQESIEHQIARIESLLSEADDSYDLRIYNVRVGCTINRDIGGTESETATEIRGIAGVTTVRPVADAKRDVTPTAEYVLYDIKFELLGMASRVEYRDEILLPAMRQIRGLKLLTVSSMHRINKKGTIRTVRESETLKEYGLGGNMGGFGGLAGALGGQRYTHGRKMQTPRPMMKRIIDDWVEGGVMAYDMPTDTTDMAYHVMMPISELLPYTSREYRGDMNDFRGRYQDFIRNGAQNPVYVAIGQTNGRVRVTGNEDLIWFAKKAGLKELPVFFSFQKQV